MDVQGLGHSRFSSWHSGSFSDVRGFLVVQGSDIQGSFSDVRGFRTFGVFGRSGFSDVRGLDIQGSFSDVRGFLDIRGLDIWGSFSDVRGFRTFGVETDSVQFQTFGVQPRTSVFKNPECPKPQCPKKSTPNVRTPNVQTPRWKPRMSKTRMSTTPNVYQGLSSTYWGELIMRKDLSFKTSSQSTKDEIAWENFFWDRLCKIVFFLLIFSLV